MPNRKASSKKVVLLSNNPRYNLSSYASTKKMTAVEAVTNENNLNGVLHLEQIQGEHFNTPVLDNTEENLTPIAMVLQPCLVHDPQLYRRRHHHASEPAPLLITGNTVTALAPLGRPEQQHPTTVQEATGGAKVH